MNFLWPAALLGLVLIPLAVFGYLILQRRRLRYAVRFTNLDLLAGLVDGSPAWRRHVPPTIFLAALTLLIVAVGRPEATVVVPREQATVVMTIDTSGSMGATDIKPSRLEAARSAALLFLDQLPDHFQVAIVSFATAPRVLAPPTVERLLLKATIDTLRAEGRTALGDALALSVELGKTSFERPSAASEDEEEELPPPVSIVLLSDGANSAGELEPLDAVSLAVQAQIPVYTIALGTSDGTVQVLNTSGRVELISVPPDRNTVQQIAEQTGGRFFDAPTAEELRAVYQEIRSQVGLVEERRELTNLFAAAAGLLMLVGAGLSAFWFNRFP